LINPVQIASQLFTIIDELPPDTLPLPGKQQDAYHLQWMCATIMNGTISEEKSFLWIGYIQGILTAFDGVTLQSMRELVHDSYH